jgi:GT2 family glycosyltransferase
VIADTSAKPRVWAIVLTHGGAEEITAACFESLQKQDYPALTVLLVDNASFDGSGARLRDRFPANEYLNTGGNFGYAGGNNRGVKYALEHGADYLLVLNNDTILEPSCISVLVNSALRVPTETLGAVAPKILFFDEPGRIWFGGGDYSAFRVLGAHRREMEMDDPKEAARMEPMTFATGCCFLMPAGAARAVGMFAEDFFIYAEDVELSLRLTRSGRQLFYQPAARMYHREKPRSNATAFQIRYRDRNRRRIARRHLGLGERLVFAAWFYPTRAIRLLQCLGRGDWARARAVVAGVIER